MSKRKSRKQKLFEVYSQNLSWVKAHSNISFNPDFTEAYICPICFELFERESLITSCNNPLTFDHNPPQSLGGKDGILTCKDCNSKAGSKIDAQLLILLEELDFGHTMPKSKARVILEQDNNNVTTDISIQDDGVLKLNLNRKNSNPIHVDNFLASKTYTYKAYDPFLPGHDFLECGWNWNLNFNMKIQLRANERLARIALLKIAYLYAFQKFGNCFIVNPHLSKVREQILNPEKNILPETYFINYHFPENFIGLNIINTPKEFYCFVVVFNLVTKSSTRQFAVALPGFSSPGYKIYENIESILCQNKEGFTRLNFEHLEERNYVGVKKWTFAPLQYWKNLIL